LKELFQSKNIDMRKLEALSIEELSTLIPEKEIVDTLIQ
jgi:hypothetical protein